MSARRTVAGSLVGVVLLSLGACAQPGPLPSPTAPASTSAASTSAASTGVASASADPTLVPGPASASPTSRADAQTAVDRLFAAGAAGDRVGWDARVATLDASFAARSSVLFDNLRALRPSRLRVRLTGAVPPPRLVGAYAPAGSVDVMNRLRGPFEVNASAMAAGIASLNEPRTA